MQYTNKFKWYINENEGWQKILELQTNEIPEMEKMLTTIIEEDQFTKKEKERRKVHFSRQLEMQQKQIMKLNSEFGQQQQRLSLDCENDIVNDIDAFCTQDILRERIRDIEKTYVELKCNFMNYLSTIL